MVRKICIALCLSLFASLIHAAGMPMETVGRGGSPMQETSQYLDQGQGHLHSEASHHHQKSPMQTSKHLCHGDNYQCCLGIVVSLLPRFNLSTTLTEHFVPVNSPWVISPVVNFIYKPPKYIV